MNSLSAQIALATLLFTIPATVLAFDPGTALEGIDPINDQVINSVFDRSLARRPYVEDQHVLAYSGEFGHEGFGIIDSDCYKKEGGGSFTLDGLYRGAFGQDYLCYDGHPGVDFKALDDWVLAIDKGIVNVVINTRPDDPDPDLGLGNFIEIKHDEGYVSRYGHLKKGSILVAEGQSVVKGQRIAVSGNSGASGGPHLHLQISKIGGGYVDPYDFWKVPQAFNYDEQSAGDIPGTYGQGLVFRLGVGVNTVTGIGNAPDPIDFIDFDGFSIMVPDGRRLTSISLSDWGPAAFAFMRIRPGIQPPGVVFKWTVTGQDATPQSIAAEIATIPLNLSEYTFNNSGTQIPEGLTYQWTFVVE